MKKMLILVAVVSLVAGALFADEATLIDFTKLKADTREEAANPNYRSNDEDAPNQNRQTLMNFANVRFTGSFTDDQRAAMKSSLAIQNWEVHLSSSSRTITNMVNSFTREATSRSVGRANDGNDTVMGVRIHFPVENFHSRAFIRPPFEIPAFERPLPAEGEEGDDTENDENFAAGYNTKSRFEDGYGVIKNVGTIKSIAVNVYGLNFPHGLWTHIIDGEGTEKSMFMGFLNFDGWGQLRWDNPQYIQEVRNRDLRLYPLYPDSMPFIKFAGFEIRRDASNKGGDFITYFKDVQVIFDRAVIDFDKDIDDEATWNIIRDRETARKLWQMEQFGQNQVIRYIDQQKQTPRDTEFRPHSNQSGQQAADDNS